MIHQLLSGGGGGSIDILVADEKRRNSFVVQHFPLTAVVTMTDLLKCGFALFFFPNSFSSDRVTHRSAPE